MSNFYIPQKIHVLAQKYIDDSDIIIYIQYLKNHGYSISTSHDYFKSIVHFAQWRYGTDVSCSNVTIQGKHDFLDKHLPNCTCEFNYPKSRKVNAAALTHWFKEVVKCPLGKTKQSFHDSVILQYKTFLQEIRGLSSATCAYHCRYAHEFLNWLEKNKSIKLQQLNYQYLHEFILFRATQVSVATTSQITYSINSFIKFLSIKNYCHLPKQTYIPKAKLMYSPVSRTALSSTELQQLFSAIDLNDPMGKRDYAVIRCLCDLGLRTVDIASLTLENILWRKKQIVFYSNKSRKQYMLPIPDVLLYALVGYIQNARPITKVRNIFVYHRAPVGEAIKTTTVRGIVRRVFAKAGFVASDSQVHRLRYTLANRLLNNHTPLKTIADVLGHKSIDTTMRYTCLNKQQLNHIALPWPNGGDL